MIDTGLLDRIQQHARQWSVTVEDMCETESSVIVFGVRVVNGLKTHSNQPVVLKVVRQPGDEWHSGEVLKAFNGNGCARVYEHAPGAALLERLRPGVSLVDLTLNGRDEEATNILAAVIQKMSSAESSATHESTNSGAQLQPWPTVNDWAKGFDLYVATSYGQIPYRLVEAGQSIFLNLCASQRQPRLLHGDLQHYNVLFDSARGWLAIDPKGVLGESEFEVGAWLRNPTERPDLFLSRPTIERRLGQLTTRLNLDYERALAWGFAQAVLSAIWEIEDGYTVDTTSPALRLAEVMRSMLKG